jgi:hypothetical protein
MGKENGGGKMSAGHYLYAWEGAGTGAGRPVKIDATAGHCAGVGRVMQRMPSGDLVVAFITRASGPLGHRQSGPTTFLFF